MRQFENHPQTSYELNGEKFAITNFFIHFALRDVLKNNQNFLMTYDLAAAERPDAVAEKIYGDSDLAWLILMTNDIVDPTQDWIHNTTDFQSFLSEKYQNASEMYKVAYRALYGIVADFGATSKLNNGESPFGTKLSSLEHDATDITKYDDVTRASAEDELNEGRRTIKLIKKEYVQAVLAEINKRLSEAS